MIEIRNIISSDVNSVDSLATACGLSYWNLEEYHAETQRDDSVFLGAFEDQKILCGFIIGRIVPSADSGIKLDAEIYNVGVKQSLRKLGIGSKLLKLFFRDCQKREVRSVWLDVRKSNKVAKEFYAKHGFIAVAERKSFYREPVEDAIVMRTMFRGRCSEILELTRRLE